MSERIKELIPPIIFPHTKLTLKFRGYDVVIDSRIYGEVAIEHDSDNVYLTISKKDSREFECNF